MSEDVSVIEIELLRDICERVGCVFARAAIGVCRVKYEGDVVRDFGEDGSGSCELAVVRKGENKFPARISKKGAVKLSQEPVRGDPEKVHSTFKYGNASNGKVIFLGKR